MENDFQRPRVLGRSGLTVGRLGLAASYGAPAEAFERAFELGCNYFYWGSLRRDGMGRAIRHLAAGYREKLVVVLQSYSRFGTRLEKSIEAGLRRLNLDYADILLLGWHNTPIRPGLMEAALRLKARGRTRHVAVSGHYRPVFRQFAQDVRFDALMVRYNAAHRGAETDVFPYLESPGLPRPGLVTYTTTRWKTLLDPRCSPTGRRTPTAVDCYRFVLSNLAVDVCLTGPASGVEMEANLKALELGPMSDDQMHWMRVVGDHAHRVTARSWRNPFMQREQ